MEKTKLKELPKAPRMMEFKHKVPIVNYTFRVLIYDDVEKYNEWAAGKGVVYDMSENNGAFVVFENGRNYIFLLADGKTSLGIIAHECNHLLNEIFAYVGYEPKVYNDEMQSYFLGYLVDLVEKDYLKFKNYG